MSGRPARSGTLVRGGVSERPKEHASKACVGASPPWVQIPPPPPAVLSPRITSWSGAWCVRPPQRHCAPSAHAGTVAGVPLSSVSRHAAFDFTGAVVLVTGGGTGIGLSVAEEFWRAGASVAVTG